MVPMETQASGLSLTGLRLKGTSKGFRQESKIYKSLTEKRAIIYEARGRDYVTKILKMVQLPFKRCKFYDELHAIMATRTCANPQHVRDSVTRTNPDLLNGTTPNDSLDSSTPRDSSPTPANPVSQTNKDTSNNTNNNDHNTSVATITPTVRGGGSKRKRSSKGCEPQGLEKVLSDSYKFRFDCFNAKERREDKRDKAREKREDKRDKRQAKQERKQNKIQAKREQVDAQIKLRNAKTDEVGKRLQYVREMKDLGFDQAEIDNFMSNQFSQ
ncbi:hypothetical protein PCASD_25186, partial [Puccinia coronata f. sp. avenae]